jgi:hypothetical protein
MYNYPETRAGLFRRALNLEGIGGPHEVSRLLTWLGGLVSVTHCRHATGELTIRPDGGAHLSLPLKPASCWEATHSQLHELGHFFTGPVWVGEPGGERDREKEEERAEEFRLAFLLPREIVRGACRDSRGAVAQIAYTAGVDATVICERFDWHLMHPEPDYHLPQPWSAFGKFKVTTRFTDHHRVIVVVGENKERFAWLCRDEEEHRTLGADINASLLSVTPAEFLLQHHSCRVRSDDYPMNGRRLAG